MSAGMQYGIAIPHGRTDSVSELVCAIGLKQEGVDFGSIDGEPSRIFVLTRSPLVRPAPHVHFMSSISRILDNEGRERVLAAETREALWAALTGTAVC